MCGQLVTGFLQGARTPGYSLEGCMFRLCLRSAILCGPYLGEPAALSGGGPHASIFHIPRSPSMSEPSMPKVCEAVMKTEVRENKAVSQCSH